MCPLPSSRHSGRSSWLSKTTTWCGPALAAFSASRSGPVASSERLLAYGTTSALALAALPESFSRPFAVPTGVALIGLGISLWREQRRQADIVDAPATAWVAQPVTR